jgi:hypothetical protein
MKTIFLLIPHSNQLLFHPYANQSLEKQLHLSSTVSEMLLSKLVLGGHLLHRNVMLKTVLPKLAITLT